MAARRCRRSRCYGKTSVGGIRGRPAGGLGSSLLGGLIALATDHTSERDFARMCDPNQVGVYVNRVFNENPTTPENLRRMEPRLRAAAAEILPEEVLDAIYYGCTSSTGVTV